MTLGFTGAAATASNASVYIVIVTYNAAAYVDRCLRCVYASTVPVEVLVVDNGSTDDTLARIRNDFPMTDVVASPRNLGFGSANNIGLEKFLRSCHRFTLLLNQDVYLEPDTLQRLIDAHGQSPRFDLLCPVQMAPDGSGVDLRFQNYLNETEQGGGSDPASDAEPVVAARFANAAAWLLSRRAVRTVGGFDPLFFHYGEDNDYAARLAYHRMQLGICTGVRVVHDRPQNSLPIANMPLRSAIAHQSTVDLIALKALDRNLAILWAMSVLRSIAGAAKGVAKLDFRRSVVTLAALARNLRRAPSIYRHRQHSFATEAAFLKERG